MARIKLPVTPRSAYDPQRPANALLLSQVHELETALSDRGRRIRRKKPKTEEQVAAYIRHLNRALHHQVLLPPMTRRPLDVPLAGEPAAPRRTSRRASAKRPAAHPTRRKKSPSRRKSKRGRRS